MSRTWSRIDSVLLVVMRIVSVLVEAIVLVDVLV